MSRKFFHKEQLLGIFILAVLLLLSRTDPYPVQYIREKCFDSYQSIKPRPLPSAEDRLVTIIDIDEQSLQEMGQWPWSRRIIAQLIINLQEMGVTVIAFDIVFAEPDRLNPGNLITLLEDIPPDIRNRIQALESNDEILGRALAQSDTVLGRACFWDRVPNRGAVLPRNSIAIRKLRSDARDATAFLIDIPTLTSNLSILEENAKGIGAFTFKSTLDGIIREVPLISQNNGNIYPTLAVESIRVALQIPTIVVSVEPNGIRAIDIAPKSLIPPDGLRIATDESGQVRPYFADHDPSLYISASDILKKRIDPSRLMGKIAFVGTSASGLLDIQSTPVSPLLPGVEIHAQIVENMLAIDRKQGALIAANQFLTRSQFISRGCEILLIGLSGLLMIFFTSRLGSTNSLLLFLLFAGAIMAGSWYLFSERRILLDPTFAIFTSILLYTILTYINLTREESSRRQIRMAFSKYLSPAMVNVLAERPEQLKLGGEKRDMTLLFCDVRGFTRLSEQFDAEGLTRLINRLLSPLTDVILTHKGTVDKYMGDCIMAFWNAPLDDAQHARHACLAALNMLKEVEKLNGTLQQEGGENQQPIQLRVGFGINSGECVVGNMGSDQRFDYSVLGNTVNLASRLEGQTKNYGVPIIIGESTQAQVDGLATFELDRAQVKGKSEAITIFALIGDESVAATVQFQAFQKAVHAMLDKWRGQDWQGARESCAIARELGKPYDIDGLFDLYDQRATAYQAHPPGADWNGIFIATTK